MKRSRSFVFLLLVFATWSARAKTNALLIAIDDLNDWVGCMNGHPQARTPNIDRLAKRGMLFTNAHCQGPICGPSRASLLSGFYPHRTGIYQQPGGKAMEKDAKFFHGRMMPQFFSAHGYATWGVGKIAHGYSDKKLFDVYGGKFYGSGPKPPNGKRFNYYPPEVPWTGTQTDWGAFPDRDEDMTDHKVADWAVDRLSRKNQASTRPHGRSFGHSRDEPPDARIAQVSQPRFPAQGR